jgi:hypothetical protein
MSESMACGFFVLLAIIIWQLMRIRDAVSALAKGRAAEIKRGWDLHTAYRLVSEAHNGPRAEFGTAEYYEDMKYRNDKIGDILAIQAGIADAYDPNGGTKNGDAFDREQEKQEKA